MSQEQTWRLAETMACKALISALRAKCGAHELFPPCVCSTQLESGVHTSQVQQDTMLLAVQAGQQA